MPSRLKMMYCGIRTTWCGSISVATMNANITLLMRKRSRAKA